MAGIGFGMGGNLDNLSNFDDHNRTGGFKPMLQKVILVSKVIVLLRAVTSEEPHHWTPASPGPEVRHYAQAEVNAP